jgi:hypothetical protein
MNITTGGSAAPQRKVWKGWAEIGGKRFYAKSKWEYNYAQYLNFMVKHKKIIDWDYEPKTFTFLGVTKGCVSYKPDFFVKFPNGYEEYIEVKGWEQSSDRTKWKRMAKYYPEINLRIINKKFFNENGKILSGVIKDWMK